MDNLQVELNREVHCRIHNARDLCCGHRDHCGPHVRGELQFNSGVSGKNAAAVWILLVPLAHNRSLGFWMSSQIALWIRGCAFLFRQFTLNLPCEIMLVGASEDGALKVLGTVGRRLLRSRHVAKREPFQTDWVGIFVLHSDSAGNNSSCPPNETLYFSATQALLFFKTGSTKNDGLRAGLAPRTMNWDHGRRPFSMVQFDGSTSMV